MDSLEVQNQMKEYMKEDSHINKEELENFTSYLVNHHVKIHDDELKDIFCTFLFKKLKGSNSPQKFKETFNANYNKKRICSFKMSNDICEDRSRMHSKETQHQFAREEKTGKIFCLDNKKNFYPTKNHKKLFENITKTLKLSLFDKVTPEEQFGNYCFTPFSKVTVEEIMNNPKLVENIFKED